MGEPYPGLRPTWATVDLGAVRHNAALLKRLAAPAALCAVVKADAYGHGTVAVARAAVEGGASWLAVALVEEGVALRDAGIDAPVLVLSEPPAASMGTVVDRGLTPTLYTAAAVDGAARAAAAAGTALTVQVKVDTGMHRVGADPADVVSIVTAVDAAPGLRFGGLWSHLAVADEVDDESRAFTAGQVALLAETRAALAAAGLDPPLVHLANSAGAIAVPETRLDMVRCGISLYGVVPTPALAPVLAAQPAVAGGEGLRPVLSLRSRVSLVRTLEAGERPSYGRRTALGRRSVVATVPIGYADGVPRRYGRRGGTVLIGGRRRPLAGTVTMDQIVVDCGPDAEVSVGDEVVLIGRQGEGCLSVQDWADVLGTIGNEVLTEIGSRVPRVVVDGAPGEEEKT
ncbi:MAG TPA: alanine racemase [Acidimicrobiales bacterium]|nr:alanine racemase [Acidimicrobiales bacterium]